MLSQSEFRSLNFSLEKIQCCYHSKCFLIGSVWLSELNFVLRSFSGSLKCPVPAFGAVVFSVSTELLHVHFSGNCSLFEKYTSN